GLAERRKPGVAEQQVDARGEEAEDEDLGEQERAVVVEDRRRRDEQGEHREHDDEPVPGHLPNSPCGRPIRIKAIAAKSANGAAWGSRGGGRRRPPGDGAGRMNGGATKARVIEPRPPTTTTISASSSTSSPPPGVPCSIGPPMTPANVASADPASSTDSVITLTLWPSADTIARSSTAARRIAPSWVRSKTRYDPTAST